MAEQIAGWIVVLLLVYLGLGVLFALPFVLFGVDRIDAVARESRWGFRVMIFPGSVALWPVLMLRWLGAKLPPEERNAHRLAARRSR
jgi:hypothetical protein